MRISHRELAQAVRGPADWLRSRGEKRFFQLGYKEVVRLSIMRFHKTGDAEDARIYLKETLDRNRAKLTNAARIQGAQEHLDAYLEWAIASAVDVVESRVNIDLDSGQGLHLRGRVSRVDLVPGGYRVVLLDSFGADWDAELRMPLLQTAVAKHYAVPADQTRIGVQDIDGSNLRARCFGDNERAEAMTEFRRLARTLGAN